MKKIDIVPIGSNILVQYPVSDDNIYEQFYRNNKNSLLLCRVVKKGDDVSKNINIGDIAIIEYERTKTLSEPGDFIKYDIIDELEVKALIKTKE